jgi:hypothetical protein
LLEWLPLRTQTTNVGENVGEKEYTIIHCWWECKLVQPLWKIVWKLLKKLKIELPYGPAIPPLEIYPKECESGYNKGCCSPMFPAALLTITEL